METLSVFYALVHFICSMWGNNLFFTEAIKLSCIREQKFVKVTQDGLPLISPLKITTALNAAFCTTNCLNYEGCESIIFNNSRSENNCQFSGEVNGASSNGPSTVTYVTKIRHKSLCEINTCQHDAKCSDMCMKPYYHCKCISGYFKGRECQINNICDTNPCKNGGTCSAHPTYPYYTCACIQHWGGDICQNNLRCQTNPCVHGWCHQQDAYPYFYCTCENCWSGNECQSNQRCNWCNPCQNGALCHTQSGHPYYHCHCTTWYGGYDCDKFLGIG